MCMFWFEEVAVWVMQVVVFVWVIPLVLAERIFKACVVLALTISSGSPFHVVGTLVVNKYFLMFSLLPLLKIFLEWPLVADVHLGGFGSYSLVIYSR